MKQEKGVFTPGRVMSTKMMPATELEDLEKHISELISGLTKITKEGKEDISILILLLIFHEICWSLRGCAVQTNLMLEFGWK